MQLAATTINLNRGARACTATRVKPINSGHQTNRVFLGQCLKNRSIRALFIFYLTREHKFVPQFFVFIFII